MRNLGGGGRGAGSFFPNSLREMPVTKGLLIATCATFLLYFFAGQSTGPVAQWVPFLADPVSLAWLVHPWTWLTHPFLETSPLWMLFGLYWLYQVGGMLERSWGSRNFAVIFFVLSAIAAVALVPAAYLLHKTVLLAGLYVPLAALTVAWAALDPYLEVCFWGMPMKARTLSLVTVLLLYFFYGLNYHDPVLALFILAAPGAAWFYVRKMPRLNIGFRAPRTVRHTRREPLLREDTPAGRERVGRAPRSRREEKEEIERLKRLLGEDDDLPPRRR